MTGHALGLGLDTSKAVNILRTADELDAVRPIWEQWETHPASTIDTFRESLRADPRQAPCLLLLSAGGVPRVLMIGRTITTTLEFKIGYATVYRMKARVLSVVERGLLGQVGDEEARRLIEIVIGLLAAGEADMAHFACLPVGSPIYERARRLPSWRCRSYFISPEKRWLLELPDGFEEFLQQLPPRRRHNEQRLQRKLEKAFGARLRVRSVCGPDQIRSVLDEVDRVASRTYQRRLGIAFANTQPEREYLEAMARRGKLEVDLLSIDDEPVAFWYGRRDRSVYLLDKTGYDPRFAEFRVGNYLLLKVIERLCGSSDVKVIDFGLGDAMYKQAFSNASTMECHVRIFSPSGKGMLLNMARSATLLGNDVVTRALKTSRAYEYVKRIARGRRHDA